MSNNKKHLAKAAAPIYAALLAKQAGSRPCLGVADTAKLVRAALKDAFPSVKFSVRSDSYSGGASIDIRWVDGPTSAEVEKISRAYEGADFDGTIDLKSYRTAWLSPDGVASLAHAQGTEGSMGCHSEAIGSPNHPNAIEVHFGADYIHTNRDFSPEVRMAALEEVRSYWAGLDELAPRPEYIVKTSGSHSWLSLSSDPWLPNHSCHLSTLIGRHLHGKSFIPVTA